MIKALYGINSSKATWRTHMTQSMYDVNVLSKANTDVLVRAATKPEVLEQYDYLHPSVDDILLCFHQAKEVMKMSTNVYRPWEKPVTMKVYAKVNSSFWRIDERV